MVICRGSPRKLMQAAEEERCPHPATDFAELGKPLHRGFLEDMAKEFMDWHT